MRLILLIMIMLNISYGDKLTHKQEKAVDAYYVKYKFEWEYIIKDVYKAHIEQTFIKGTVSNRRYITAAIHFLESRGGMPKYLSNIHVRKDGSVSIDCGDYGISTDTFAHITKSNRPTSNKAIDYCYALKNDKELSHSIMMRVLDVAEERYTGRGYSSKELGRKMANYYNTGRDKYIGTYYLEYIALVKLFKEVL